MLTTRLVVGKIYKANGDSVKSSKVLFKLLNSSFTYESQIVKSEIIANVDDQGNLYTIDSDNNLIPGVKLWSNENGEIASQYICYLPGNESFKFTLPDGNDSIELSILRQAGITEIEPQYQTLATYVDNLVAGLGNSKLKFDFNYGDASPTILISNFTGIIESITLNVTQAFNGDTSSSISIVDDNSLALLPVSSSNLAFATAYEVLPFQKYTQPIDIFLNINLGESANQGSGFILIEVKGL